MAARGKGLWWATVAAASLAVAVGAGASGESLTRRLGGVESATIPSTLAPAARRAAIQASGSLLAPEEGSDDREARVYMALDEWGRRSVLVVHSLKPNAGRVNDFSIWFVDAIHRTYKAIRLDGSATDAVRIQNELAARGQARTPQQVSDGVARIWSDHLRRASKIAARKPAAPRFPRGATRGAGVPGETSASMDSEYCYGWVDFFDYYEDPIWINVAETSFSIEFDGYWNSPWTGGANCWAKDAGSWPPPANTTWYVDSCSEGGYDSGWGFDRNLMSAYHNDDWGWNNQQTGVWMLPGVQYTWSIPANRYVQHDAWGEDYNYLTFVNDDYYDYVCWYSPLTGGSRHK